MIEALLLTLLWQGSGVSSHYTISEARSLDGYGESVGFPLALLQAGEDAVILDQDWRLWLVNDQGTPRPAATSHLEGAAFSSLYQLNGALYLLDQAGFRTHQLTLDGRLKATTMRTDGFLYADPDQTIEVLDADRQRVALDSVSIFWRRGGEEKVIPLVPRDRDDRVPYSSCRLAQVGHHLVIINTHGQQETLYYANLDTRTGSVVTGSLNLLDERPREADPNMPSPLLMGLSSNTSEVVLTEHTVPGEFRIVRHYNPANNSWQALRISFDEGDFRFFHPNPDGSWLAFHNDHLQRVTLQRAP